MKTVFYSIRMTVALCLVADLSNGSTQQLVSTPNPGLPATLAAGGDSINPIVSSDGRYVLFSSSAENLVSLGTDFSGTFASRLNVFLRDLASDTITVVSVNEAGTGAGNGDSYPAGVSTNGRYALFTSWSSDLVPGDDNGAPDVFLRDLVAGTTILITANTGGTPGFGPSGQPAMTPDGRTVVFASLASDLVPDDTNWIRDIFVRDVQSMITTLVSVGAERGSVSSASSDAPQITSDGRYVSFLSTATNLLAGVASSHVYVRDLQTGVTWLASTNLEDVSCYSHQFSGNGQYVFFEASPADANAAGTIYRCDLTSFATETITTTALGFGFGNKHFRSFDVSHDGERVAFIGKSGDDTHIYVWNGSDGSITSASGQSSPAASEFPVLDPAGNLVSFVTTAAGLVTNTAEDGLHLYVRDLRSGVTTLVDQATNGHASNKDFLNPPQFAADGQFLFFDCTDSDMVAGDNSRGYDVFRRSVSDGPVELISKAAEPSNTQSGLSLGSVFSVSADARYVAFASPASGVLSGSTNQYWNIFVRDLDGGDPVRASVPVGGATEPNHHCSEPSLSANGRVVAFTSLADNLVADDTNLSSDVFIRDLVAETNALVSVNRYGTGAPIPGGADSFSPVLSEDGRFVLFASEAYLTQPSPSPESLFWRDLASDLIVKVNARITASAMSPDGNYVAFAGAARKDLFLWHSVAQTIVFSNNTPELSLVAVSADGNRLAGERGNSIYVADRALGTNFTLVASTLANAPSHPKLQFSTDARFLVYVTAEPVVSSDPNSEQDIYVYDFESGINNLISTGAASPAEAPAISSNGRFVAFRTIASPSQIYLWDRQTGSNTLISASSKAEKTSNGPSFEPKFSADGRTLFFQSWASDLTGQDYNQRADLFALQIAASSFVEVMPAQIVFVPAASSSPVLTWSTLPGRSYKVQYKQSLSDQSWRDLPTTVTINGSHASASDPDPDPSRRFYRVVAE